MRPRTSAAELRREAARKPVRRAEEWLVEREAVWIAPDRGEGRRVRRAIGIGDRRAVRGSHALGGQHVADQQRVAAVAGVHAAAVVRVPEVEAADHLLGGVIGVAVKLGALSAGAEVGE